MRKKKRGTKMDNQETFRSLMNQYEKDLKEFGFGDYDIDFSNVKDDAILAILIFIRDYNRRKKNDS